MTHTLARRTDPATSHKAAARVKEFSEAQHCRIAEVLRLYGPLGAEEIGDELGLQPYKVRKRLSDLERMGQAAPTGDTRRTKENREERIWSLT